MKNVSGWKRSGNPAIDMAAEAIYKARLNKRPLRSITFRPAYFAMVVAFAAQKAGEEKLFSSNGDLAAPIVCDGVAILRGSQFQVNAMAFDFWPMGNKEVQGYKEIQEDTGQYPEHLSLLQ